MKKKSNSGEFYVIFFSATVSVRVILKKSKSFSNELPLQRIELRNRNERKVTEMNQGSRNNESKLP